MKIPLLHDLDMARIAPQPVNHKRAALEAYRLSHPPYSYVPVRKSFADILNAQTGFLPRGPRVPFAKITDIIRSASRSDDEFDANLRVAEALYNHATDTQLIARRHDILPLTFGSGSKVVFWHSLLLVQEGRPLVPFFDPRRTSTHLTGLARRFVFSSMHERIRVADPDFANVRLGIIQFTSPDKGPRKPVLYTDEGIKLFTYDELEEMVRETYEIWTEIYTRRTERERRRTGTL